MFVADDLAEIKPHPGLFQIKFKTLECKTKQSWCVYLQCQTDFNKARNREAMLASGLATDAAIQLDEALPGIRRHNGDLSRAELLRAAALVEETM